MSQNALYLILSFSFGSFWVQQNSFIQMPSSSSSHTTTKFVISMHIRFSSTLYLEHYSGTTLKAFLSIVLTILGIFSLSTFSDRLREEKVSCEKSSVTTYSYPYPYLIGALSQRE